MSTKKLIGIVLAIIVLAGAVFSYLYFTKQDPKQWFVKKPELTSITHPPQFLFAINNDPAHPLAQPMAVAVMKNRIFVSDAGNKQVAVFDYNGKFQRNLKLTQNKKFVNPYGLASDGVKLYVADYGLDTIFEFDSDGNYLGIFSPKGAELKSPGCLYIRDNKLYVSDLRTQQVYCFDLSGNLLLTFGVEGKQPGQLYFPHGVAVGDYGTLFVADSGNNRVQTFNGVGQVVRDDSLDRSKQVLAPRGLALDRFQNLWVVAGLENEIKVFDPKGATLFTVGGPGQAYGMFSLPNGIYIDYNNRIYVTEIGNRRVSVFGY